MRRLSDESGSALIAIMAIFLALAILGVALVAATGGESRSTARQVSSSQALSLADAGLEYAYSRIRSGEFRLTEEGLVIDGRYEDAETGIAVFKVTADSIDNNENVDFTIESTGIVQGPDYKRTVKLTGAYEPLSIFSYSVFTSSPDTQGIRVEGTIGEIHGNIRSYGGIRFASAPTVTGLIISEKGLDTSHKEQYDVVLDEDGDPVQQVWEPVPADSDDGFDDIWDDLNVFRDELLKDSPRAGPFCVVKDCTGTGCEPPADECLGNELESFDQSEPIEIWTWDEWLDNKGEWTDNEEEVDASNIVVIYDKNAPLRHIGEYPAYIWVKDSSVSFVGSGTVRGYGRLFPDDEGYDDQDEPVVHPIFFVDGDVDISGSVKVYASFYAKGDIDQMGTSEIYGQLAAQGDIKLGGNVFAEDPEFDLGDISFKGWQRKGWEETGRHLE